MINNFFHLLGRVSNAIILTDFQGNIIYINSVAKKLIRITKKNEINSILDIEPDFIPELIQEKKHINKHMKFKNIKVAVDIYVTSYDNINSGFLYVFEETVLSSEILDEIINPIEDIIVIYDKDGVLLKANKATQSLLPLELELEEYIGQNEQIVLEKNIAKNLVTPEIIKYKKPMSHNVEYPSGKVITYSGVPIFNENGDLAKIILTGRDISELVKLEAKLQKVKKLNNEYYNQLKELEKYREFNKLIYSSDSMDKLLKLAMRAAQTASSIFITGESGVGKEEIAKFIHKNSKRKDKPYIAINCAAIPSELLESELFGYEEGAFTGSKKGGKKGLFEEANGGTIFLDEIGELPLKMQSKILRVIQENTFMRIGGNKSITIDVRYVCATNLSKEQLTNNQKFRQDLYYRLSVIPIRIPSLRERKDDIFPLIQHFLIHFNDKYNRNISISKNIMKILYDFNWPGNVREIKNVIERLVILAEGDQINESELNMVIQLEDNNDKENEELDILVRKLIPLNEAYKILDEIMITKALKEHSSIVKAAKVLEIDPSTIHRKIKKGYNIK